MSYRYLRTVLKSHLGFISARIHVSFSVPVSFCLGLHYRNDLTRLTKTTGMVMSLGQGVSGSLPKPNRRILSSSRDNDPLFFAISCSSRPPDTHRGDRGESKHSQCIITADVLRSASFLLKLLCRAACERKHRRQNTTRWLLEGE